MPTIAELRITLDDKGGLAVNGPIDQLMLCYGMLELAKDTVRRHATEAHLNRVQAPGQSEVVLFGKR